MLRLIAAFAAFAHLGIVRRADVPDQAYLDMGSRYPAVVSLGRLGDATLIHPHWLITAAHVARGVENRGISSVRIGKREHEIGAVVIHPAWVELGAHDLALVYLRLPVKDIAPIQLSRDRKERGQVAILVGHGATGTGDSGLRNDDGMRRGATSRVDSSSEHALYFSFDQPPAGTAREGAPGAGDSGGPAILIRGGIPSVAGISSAAVDGSSGPGSYGAVDVFTRISAHSRWLDSVIARGAPRSAATSRSAEPVSRLSDITLPGTPVGRRMAEFLRVVRGRGDVDRFVRENFDSREYESRPALVQNMRRIAGLLFDARIDEIVKSSDVEIAVKFSTSAGPLTLGFLCAGNPPHKLLDWRRYD